MKLNTNLIGTFLTFLIIAVILAAIVFVFWTAVFIPMQKRDDLKKAREEEQKELDQIKIQKGVEWNRYRDLENELDKLRKSHFSEKERTAKLRIDNDKLKTHNENLQNKMKALKSS